MAEPTKRTKRVYVVVAGCALVAASCVTRVSTTSEGAQVEGPSSEPSISGDGRYVAFVSTAAGLAEGTTAGVAAVYVKDTLTGDVALVSSDSSGVPANGASGGPAISSDGHHVAFSSPATNLVAGDTNGVPDVFVKDLRTGELVLASASGAGERVRWAAGNTSISEDGRFVAFTTAEPFGHTADPNIDPRFPPNPFGCLFVKDLQTGELVLAGSNAAGETANDYVFEASISDDGNHVAFLTGATNLSPLDTDHRWDIFLKDLRTGAVSLVNTTSSGEKTTALEEWAIGPVVDSDGTRVAFETLSAMVPGDTNRQTDIYVKDLGTGELIWASATSTGSAADGPSTRASISADGRHVVFASNATDLVPGDTNGRPDVFSRDLQTGAIVRESSGGFAGPDNENWYPASLSADGVWVAFASPASDVVDGDTNEQMDVFRSPRG